MAEVGNKFGLGAGGGQFGGYPSFRKMAGRYFYPPHLVPTESATTMNTTGARYYIVPFVVESLTTFAGAWCYNSGVGDNGDKVKIAAYNEATGGGPGTLAKSFGEVTLTGASAVRNFASSWSASPGKYYLELVTDNAVGMFCMCAVDQATSAGFFMPNMAANTMGFLAAPPNSSARSSLVPAGDYVGGTYANFPESTSLTPVTTVAGVNQIPFFGLYT
mgnify:CR=1 FL=1